MKYVLLRKIIISSLLGLSVSCKNTETKVVREIVKTNGSAEGTATKDQHPEGTASGGGSFGDESSEYILNKAANDLITRMENLQDPIITNYPEGWNRLRLIKILKNIRRSKNKSISRYGRELMFNYGVDQKTGEPYIEALKLFYTSHAGMPVNHMDFDDFYYVMAEVRLKLLHEISHHLGIGLSEATDSRSRVFASRLVRTLLSGIVFCESLEPVDPRNKFIKTMAYLTYDRTCFEDISTDKHLRMDGFGYDLEASHYDKEESNLLGYHRLKYKITIDRSTGKAITDALPGGVFLSRPYSSDSSIAMDAFLDTEVRFDYFTTNEPNFEVQFGRDEKLVNKFNNLGFQDGFNRVGTHGSNFFDKVTLDSDGLENFTLSLFDLTVSRRTHITNTKYADGGREIDALVRFDIDIMTESIVYDPDTKSARFQVSQKADMLCNNKKVVFDAELDMAMTCEAKEVIPVSVSQYREETICGDGPVQHVECFEGGAK